MGPAAFLKQPIGAPERPHWVKRLTLGFSSGYDLDVLRSSPTLGSMLSVGSVSESLSFSPLSLPPILQLAHILSLSP